MIYNKAVRGLPYPDGLCQLSDTSGIIGDKCRASGMEHFYEILKNRKKEFFTIWNTNNFKLHQRLHSILTSI